MKTSQLVKLLRKNGWQILREGGNHTIYLHPEARLTIRVGRHMSEEVSKGALADALKKVKIANEQKKK